MARKLLAGVVLTAALGGVAVAAAAQLPILRSATVVKRHVVIQVVVGDVRPTQLTVSTRRTVDAYGALAASYVRLRDPIQLAPSSTGIVAWQSPQRVAPGTYFVQVAAVEVDTGGITDCPPKLMRMCLDQWSNVRRIVVPAG
jgi:hypothetical protein